MPDVRFPTGGATGGASDLVGGGTPTPTRPGVPTGGASDLVGGVRGGGASDLVGDLVGGGTTWWDPGMHLPIDVTEWHPARPPPEAEREARGAEDLIN